MEQVDQLKTMRDDAWMRIKATPDYKLATSLDALIADLEEALGVASTSSSVEEEEEATDSDGTDGDGGDSAAPVESVISPPTNTVEASAPEPTEPETSVAESSEEASYAEESDEDVMSELTQMIHAGLSDQPQAEAEEQGMNPAQADEADSDAGEQSADDEESVEQEAILAAMKALDEDLSKSGIGLDEKDEARDPGISDGDESQEERRKRR